MLDCISQNVGKLFCMEKARQNQKKKVAYFVFSFMKHETWLKLLRLWKFSKEGS